MAAEARIMEYARARGYPVPTVEELSDDGKDMVMERIDGADMVVTMTRRPWTIARQGRILADLHRRLHDLVAPTWLPDAKVGQGDRLLHLDLHPLNVILSPTGPMVIDWANARRGDPSVDIGLTWALIAAGEAPTNPFVSMMLGRVRSVLVKSFLESFDTNSVARNLREVVAWKVSDPHISATEQARMWRVVEEAEVKARIH